MGLDIFGGDNKNKTTKDLKAKLYGHGEGKIVISPKNSELKTSVIVSDKDVTITNHDGTVGLLCEDGSVTIQGVTYFSGKGKNIRKGEYSENDRTKKIFTFQETVLLESIPKELAVQAAGQLGINISEPMPGTNTSVGMDGMMNIMTDIAAGPIPHIHSISMKHVHRLEPGHLYRLPSSIGFIKSCLPQLTRFLNA